MKRNILVRLFCLLLAFLSACAAPEKPPVPVEDHSTAAEKIPVKTIEPEIVEPEPELPAPEPVSEEERRQSIEARPVEKIEKSDPVVLAFLNEAEQQAADGNTDQAIVSLERGVRIKPKEPWLWHQLAVLKLQKQQYREAITMAEKSIALAGDNKTLLAGNWQLIANARRALGDNQGAREADEKVNIYQPSMQS